MDTWLGKLLDHLRTIGLYDRALLVLTADHGMSFRPGDFMPPADPDHLPGHHACPPVHQSALSSPRPH